MSGDLNSINSRDEKEQEPVQPDILPAQPELDTHQMITKSPQELIHIKHNITARQYKIWFLMVRAYKELVERGVTGLGKNGHRYYIPSSYFDKMFGYKIARDLLKADLENLRIQSIMLNCLSKNGKAAVQGMGFISEWLHSESYIGFSLPTTVLEIIENEVKAKQGYMFTLLDWSILNSFNGKYEAIIYKLCKDYAGVKRTPYFSIEKYREYIGLEDHEYSEFKALSRTTIRDPIKAINENPLSDIAIEVEIKKEGRVAVGLQFLIEPKTPSASQSSPADIEVYTAHPAFDDALIEISLGAQSLYLMRHTEEEIVETIKRANQYIKELQDAGKDANIGAIYNKAFKESWGTEVVIAREKQQEVAKKQQQKKIQEAEEAKAVLVTEEMTKQAGQLLLESLFASLTEEEQQVLISTVRKRISTVAFFIKEFDASVADGTVLKNPQFSYHFKKLLGLAKEESE